MDEDIQRKYNLRSPSVKRLMREAMELREANSQYHAQPLEDNLFEWHFTVRGPADSEFEGGRYHGRIILPPEYPMKPPHIILLTPNGRFETGKKICLSMSAHHPETWQPSWSIRTVLLALIGFMPTKGGGAIGALDYTPHERKRLALRSVEWTCESCGIANKDILPEGKITVNDEADKEAKELASQIDFKGEVKTENTEGADKVTSPPSSLPGYNHPNFNLQATNPYYSFYNPFYATYGMPVPPSYVPPTAPNTATTPLSDRSNSSQVSERDSVVDGPTAANVSEQPNANGPTQPSESHKQERNSSTQEVSEASREEGLGSHDEGTSHLRHRSHLNRDTVHLAEVGSIDRRPRRRQQDSDTGYFSLVMLWLVTISLVALILRRLCMEAMNLNPQG